MDNKVTDTDNRTAIEIEHIRQMIDESIATTKKSLAEIEKLHSEARRLDAEHRWYPAIIVSTATLAIVAIAKLFL